MTTDAGPEGSAGDSALTYLSPEEIEAMCPADPDIMYSREGDIRALREARAEARARREELDRKYPGLRIS